MSVPARLLKLLETFLANKSRSNGGWAPVGEEDIQMLEEILGGIIEAKYEKDPDGDVPVRFNLVDRTRYWSNHYLNLPYTPESEAPDLKTLMLSVRVAQANLSIAQTAMDQSVRNLEFAMEHLRDGKAIRYGERSFETPLPFQDRKALLETAKARLTIFLERHMPEDQVWTDFKARQAWETETSKAACEHLGTRVAIRSSGRRNEQNQVLTWATLEALDPNTESRTLKIAVTSLPRPPRKTTER